MLFYFYVSWSQGSHTENNLMTRHLFAVVFCKKWFTFSLWTIINFHKRCISKNICSIWFLANNFICYTKKTLSICIPANIVNIVFATFTLHSTTFFSKDVFICKSINPVKILPETFVSSLTISKYLTNSRRNLCVFECALTTRSSAERHCNSLSLVYFYSEYW